MGVRQGGGAARTAPVGTRGRGWRPQLAVGLLLVAYAWGVSLLGLEPWSRYWYCPLWLGWILTADAVVLAREGRSLLHTWPRRMLLLFAFSSVFWWAFEWINWHTRNWTYSGSETFSDQMRVFLKTLSFSTVIPALAEGRDLLRSLARGSRLAGGPGVGLAVRDRRAACWLLMLAALGGIALWLAPRVAFPLVWVAPLLLLEGVLAWVGRPGVLALLRARRLPPVLLVALAGLGTGVLWEAWNWGADPHWEYHIPYVGFWRVFEMPLLGYLGYVPFALTADAFVRLVMGGRGGLAGGPVTELAPAAGVTTRQAPAQG
jgi:hypothetical protein